MINESKLLGNRYELLEEIGTGGMARVFKARCTFLNRFVAVKILKEEFANDPDFLKRFKYESQAAAGLTHPNIVSIYDVGSDGNENYIVMEYVSGTTLKEYIRAKAPLPEKEILVISQQICKALSHAHKNGIVHRDIKPHNILMQEDGVVKVADFGIARAVSSSTITLAGNTVGSVHYFSPEQARGLQTDHKSDLYSLGATIYEMATGKLVFNADTPIAVALKHVQEEPVEPANVNPGVSYNLNMLIMRLLSKNPSDRFDSASQLDRLMDKLLNQPDKKITQLKDESDTAAMKPEDRLFMKKRRKRKSTRDLMTTIIAVLVSAASVLLFAYLVFGIIIPSLDLAMDEVKEVVIENYVGEKIENVSRQLDPYRIEIIRDEVFDEIIRPGEVLEQSVKPGSTLKEGAKITLKISLGPEYVSYRDFSYTDHREAEKEIKDLGLIPVIRTEYHETMENGLVIGTEPASGTKVRLGTEVVIIRSLGPEIIYVFMPELTGLTYEEALEQIEQNNLVLEQAVNYEKEGYSNIVGSHYPSGNVKIPEGTKVTIFMEKIVETSETTVTETSETSASEGDGFVYIDQSVTLKGVELDAKFKLSIETRTSLEDQYTIYFNGEIKKSELPYNFLVKVPKGGYVDIRVYVNEGLIGETRVESP